MRLYLNKPVVILSYALSIPLKHKLRSYFHFVDSPDSLYDFLVSLDRRVLQSLLTRMKPYSDLIWQPESSAWSSFLFPD